MNDKDDGPTDEEILPLLSPALLPQYLAEKERYRNARREIDDARKQALKKTRKLFGKLRERKEAVAEEEYATRLREEDERHAAWMKEFRTTITSHPEAGAP